jgi:alanine racemase
VRPTWAEISLTALRHNFRTVQDFVAPGATVLAVVKADAYGHGAAECARALEAEGALWFGVSSTDEGVCLRQAGISGRILLMSGFWRGEEQAIVEHDLTAAVWNWGHIELLEDAARKFQPRAKTARGRASHPVPVHLKIDTGMARLGIHPNGVAEFADVIKQAEHVTVEGAFSHFASAEVLDSPAVGAQVEHFDSAVAALHQRGLHPVYLHLANSAALATRPNTWKNMVRPGISLYGYYLPFTSVISSAPDPSHELPVKPVLSWKTRILALRDVREGSPISYNGTYVTPAPARIAVLPVGYADGLSRHLSSSGTGRGRVMVRGDYAAIVGTVTMDMTMIDVTGIPADVGDEVILIGASGNKRITAWELASHAQTIPYEILCGISKRVCRKCVE